MHWILLLMLEMLAIVPQFHYPHIAETVLAKISPDSGQFINLRLRISE